MTRDFTLQDLAGEASEEAAEAAAETATDAASEAADAEGGETAKWLVELYSEMKDDGTLQAILFGPDAAREMSEQPIQQQQTPDPEMSDNLDPADAINAETIANVGNLVIEEIGDVPLSTVVQACEERPATINQVIQSKGDEIFGEQDEPAANVEADRDDDRDEGAAE